MRPRLATHNNNWYLKLYGLWRPADAQEVLKQSDHRSLPGEVKKQPLDWGFTEKCHLLKRQIGFLWPSRGFYKFLFGGYFQDNDVEEIDGDDDDDDDYLQIVEEQSDSWKKSNWHSAKRQSNKKCVRLFLLSLHCIVSYCSLGTPHGADCLLADCRSTIKIFKLYYFLFFYFARIIIK
jgi:hypothetical protein